MSSVGSGAGSSGTSGPHNIRQNEELKDINGNTQYSFDAQIGSLQTRVTILFVGAITDINVAKAASEKKIAEMFAVAQEADLGKNSLEQIRWDNQGYQGRWGHDWKVMGEYYPTELAKIEESLRVNESATNKLPKKALNELKNQQKKIQKILNLLNRIESAAQKALPSPSPASSPTALKPELASVTLSPSAVPKENKGTPKPTPPPQKPDAKGKSRKVDTPEEVEAKRIAHEEAHLADLAATDARAKAHAAKEQEVKDKAVDPTSGTSQNTDSASGAAGP